MNKRQKSVRSTEEIKHAHFRRRLESLVYENGGDLFGVADLKPAREFIMAQGVARGHTFHVIYGLMFSAHSRIQQKRVMGIEPT